MSKRQKRMDAFRSRYAEGARTRSEFLEAFCPEGGVPIEKARNLWLSREFDQATSALREEGEVAISFGGEVVYSEDGSDLSQKQRNTIKLRMDSLEKKAASYNAAARRLKTCLDQLPLFDMEDDSVCL